MKNKGIMYEKSRDFAIRIIGLHDYLMQRNEKTMSKQILRSGTSIGANYSEALGAESDADFIHKLNISQKEILETQFWLDLLSATNLIDNTMYKSLYDDTEELYRLFSSSVLSTRKKLNAQPNN